MTSDFELEHRSKLFILELAVDRHLRPNIANHSNLIALIGNFSVKAIDFGLEGLLRLRFILEHFVGVVGQFVGEEDLESLSRRLFHLAEDVK